MPLAEAEFGLTLEPEIALVALALPPRDDSPQTPASAAARRELEFRAGRDAAARALARFGVSAEVPRAPDGRPCWPSGFVGSITHGGALAVAAIARHEAFIGIGIDVEHVLESSACADIRDQVSSEPEIGFLRAAFPTLTTEQIVTLIFSSKESLYKCLSPATGCFLEFADVRVTGAYASGDHARIVLELARDLGPLAPRGASLEARFVLREESVRTAVLARGTRSHA